MKIDTTYRSDLPEMMDDFAMEGEVLRDALDKIAHINQLLGGNKVTLQGIKALIKNKEPHETISILDVGCGNGDMLRTLAEYGQKVQRSFKLTGIDANNFTISHARDLSADYANISYRCADIFDVQEENHYDIILCTLTLHHFKDQEILTLLSAFAKQSRLGFVVNDLHRSTVAYYLFNALCFVFRLNDMSREDGLVSILRGFKKEDFIRFSKKLNLNDFQLKWKWAFRYQWIVKTYG